MIDKEIQLLMLKGEKGDPGTGDYEALTNKPKINGVELLGNKTASDLSLASEADLNAAVADIAANAANIATNTTNIAANTANIGTLASLATVAKTDLVAAINEVNADTFSKNVEFGTWTPTLRGENYGEPFTLPTYTQIAFNGIYYRIGRLVFVSAHIRAEITAAGSGTRPAIGGLPYLPNSTPGATWSNVGIVMATQPSDSRDQLTTMTGSFRPAIGADRYIALNERARYGGGEWWKTTSDGYLWLGAAYITNI